MSRLAVRNAFIAELQNVLGAQVPPVPYYQTDNVTQSPTDDLWTTVLFYTDFIEDFCYSGGKRVENGSIDVRIYSRPGQGSTASLTLGEVIEDHFRTNTDLGGGVEIVSTEGLSEVTAGDAQPVYGVSLILDYQYYL